MGNFSTLDNLRDWIKSGEGRQWVDRHGAEWTDAEWQQLLAALQSTRYWPMRPVDVGDYIESVKIEYNAKRLEILDLRHSRLRSATVWYMLGLGILGLLIGVLAGISSSPVVGTTLPLLFALIGGGGGLYLGGIDLKAADAIQRLRLLGKALVAFTIMSLIGLTGGICLRLLRHSPHGSSFPSVEQGTTTDYLQLAMLRRRLQILGTSADEQNVILADAAARIGESLQPIRPGQLQLLLEQAKGLREDFEEALANCECEDIAVPEEVTNAYAAVVTFSRSVAPWSNGSLSPIGMPRDLYKNAVETVWFRLSRLAMPRAPDTMKWLAAQDFPDRRLRALFEQIHEEINKRDELDWQTGRTLASTIDSFLTLSIQGRKVERIEDIMPYTDWTTTDERKKSESKCGGPHCLDQKTSFLRETG
jgi:hypothetical protein